MFPGMQGPQALPDQEAYPMFWKNFNRFVGITATAIVISLAIRSCEQRTHNMLISSL